MSEHSKLPWRLAFSAKGRGNTIIDAANNTVLGTIDDDVARLIVCSVNSHQKLVEALEAVISATQAYLPPDGISAKECISRILSATDNPTINAILSEAKSK